MNFLRVFAVCGRTRNFLRFLADRILIFLRLECNLTFHRLHVLAAQEVLAPRLARALFSGCTICLHQYNQVLSATHCQISLLLRNGGAKALTLERCAHLGISVSHSSAIRMHQKLLLRKVPKQQLGGKIHLQKHFKFVILKKQR